MAYDYLGLTNDVNHRLNEVPLTSVTFAAAAGFYHSAKEAVNSAIRQINYEQFEWPFNHVLQEETLVAETTRYAFPYDTKTVDMDSFRIKADVALGNDTSKLRIMSYEDYLDHHVKQEYEAAGTNSGLPSHIVRTPDMAFALVPVPDKAYELVYEYYRLPVDLSAATDVPNIPEQFRSVIVDGAMYYAYLFRGNTQDATLMQDKFSKGIDRMRTIYINRTDYVSSSYIDRQQSSRGYIRIN